jgi:Tol biopolymer transport system component
MPNLDDELRRRMHRAARRVGTDGLENRLHERRARKQITQKAGRGLLAVAVLAGSAFGIAGLNRAFRGDHAGGDVSSRGTVAFIRFLRPCTAVPNITDDGGLQIFTVDLATGEQRLIRVSYSFPGHPQQLTAPQAPAFSPDGTMVAWRDHYQGGLYVTDVATGATQHLAPNIQIGDPHWSPDGSKVLFMGWDAGSGDPDPRLLAQRPSDIYSVAPDGSGLTRLTTNGQLPIWTSDGRIAFMRLSIADVALGTDSVEVRSGRPGIASFFLMNADGSNVQKQYEGPGDVPIHEAEWSPDGNGIVASATFHGNTDIFSVDLTLRAASRLTDDPAEDTSPSWSPDGSQIAFHTGRWGTGIGHSEIAVMNADGSDVRRLTNDCWDDYDATWVKNDSIVRTLPTWTPPPLPDLGQPGVAHEGDIIFSDTTDNVGDIFAVDPATGQRTNLTADLADQYDPAWSPDHSKIAFSGDGEDRGNFDIYVMATDGSSLTRLTRDQGSQQAPTWSPDGSRIAFYDDAELGVMDADGSNRSSIADEGWDPAWSPDGRSIAFEREGRIFLIGPDGSDERLVGPSGGNGGVAWSTDGTQLLFARNGRLVMVAVDGTGTETIVTSERSRSDADPAWSPDGSQIVFAGAGQQEGAYRLYVMAPDGSGLHEVAGPIGFCCPDPDW